MNNIILSLDLDNYQDACNILASIDNSKIWGIKVNSLARYYGIPHILKLKNIFGVKIMLDWKLHDIPSTMFRDINSVFDDIDIITIHLNSLEDSDYSLFTRFNSKLAAITTLTSKEKVDYSEFIGNCIMANDNLINYIVCPPNIANIASKYYYFNKNIISPGIRLTKNNDDQKQIATPEIAAKNGVDFMVIGRPILNAENKKLAIDEINEEYNKWRVNENNEIVSKTE